MQNLNHTPAPIVDWIDTHELSRQIGLAKITIECRRSRGDDLPPHYKIGKRVLYKQAEVTEWLEAQRHIPAVVALRMKGGA
jgi:predicted DNA-binding transcriptional regulator AlpA